LDTGIDPNCYTSIYENEVIGTQGTPVYRSLHLTGAKIRIPSNSYDLSNFFQNVVSFTFANAVQRNVSFSANTSLITGTNLIGMMNALLDAMQTYLFFDSILTYTTNPMNRNAGMIALRNNLTATDLNNLTNLRWLLSGMPIPPNFRTLVYWFTQTYRFNDTPGGSLIKFCPVPLITNSFGNVYPDSSYISSAITGLSYYQQNYSLLSRACPDWITGKFESSNSVALHDWGFTTLFSNYLVYYSGSKGEVVYPGSSETFYMGSFDNELDGMVYALLAFSDDSGDGVYLPSLTVPVISTDDHFTDGNRYSYSDSSGEFVRATNVTDWVMRGENAYVDDSGTTALLNFAIPNGAEVTLNVSPDSVYQTSLTGVEWMMTINSIGNFPGSIRTNSKNVIPNSPKGNMNNKFGKHKFSKPNGGKMKSDRSKGPKRPMKSKNKMDKSTDE